ncbi:MAG: hypothetical protein H6765_03335 [Candidatus Peribacteria bacterium]|nr:MAG: hypothetical protein H6765_03335 [Candidatus Peribacteria bacterium]
MRPLIWILLVCAIVAVAWEYYRPAIPEAELIANVSTVTIPRNPSDGGA